MPVQALSLHINRLASPQTSYYKQKTAEPSKGQKVRFFDSVNEATEMFFFFFLLNDRQGNIIQKPEQATKV